MEEGGGARAIEKLHARGKHTGWERVERLVDPGTFSELGIAGLDAGSLHGNAYVNVHTNDGIAPVNTGAGDFPGGEIRGQVEHHGH